MTTTTDRARADLAATTHAYGAIAALPPMSPAARRRAVTRIARAHGLTPRPTPAEVAGRLVARLFMIGAHA